MTQFTIRAPVAGDAPAWTSLRHELWPGETRESLAADVQAYLDGNDRLHVAVFLAVDEQQKAIGFLELGLRPYTEGCTSSPVPHVEGWYVSADRRRIGVGRALMRAAEDWARERGYRELTSDTTIDNMLSLHVHIASGFNEVERLIAFHKVLQ